MWGIRWKRHSFGPQGAHSHQVGAWYLLKLNYHRYEPITGGLKQARAQWLLQETLSCGNKHSIDNVKSPGVSKTVSNLLCDIQQATLDQLVYKMERLGHISEFTTWSIIQIPYSIIFIVSPSTWVNGLGNEWMALADVVRFGTTQREEG